MRKLELKDIAGYLPYGLKVRSESGNIWTINTGLMFINSQDNLLPLRYGMNDTPLLRPMDDLIKWKLDNGEAPLVSIAKLSLYDADDEDFWKDSIKYGKTEYGSYIINDKNSKYVIFILNPENMYISACDDEEHGVANPHLIFDFLHQHMFDYRGLIKDGLALNINDYIK